MYQAFNEKYIYISWYFLVNKNFSNISIVRCTLEIVLSTFDMMLSILDSHLPCLSKHPWYLLIFIYFYQICCKKVLGWAPTRNRRPQTRDTTFTPGATVAEKIKWFAHSFTRKFTRWSTVSLPNCLMQLVWWCGWHDCVKTNHDHSSITRKYAN